MLARCRPAGRVDARFSAEGGRLGQGSRRQHRVLADRVPLPFHAHVPAIRIPSNEHYPRRSPRTDDYQRNLQHAPARCGLITARSESPLTNSMLTSSPCCCVNAAYVAALPVGRRSSTSRTCCCTSCWARGCDRGCAGVAAQPGVAVLGLCRAAGVFLLVAGASRDHIAGSLWSAHRAGRRCGLAMLLPRWRGALATRLR